MKNKLILGFTLITATVFLMAQNEESACYGCHLEQDEPYNVPAERFEDDIHAKVGLDCNICHGGDPTAWDYEEAKDPEAGFIGVPSGSALIAVCSKCHSDPEYIRRYNPNLPTDQEAKYWTSGHGRALENGDLSVATCVSCHGIHGIRKAAEPGSPVYHANVAETCGKCHNDPEAMAKSGLPSNIVKQYKHSVHGVALLEHGDLAAPTCNNCHGNHGAAPPDAESIQAVCGLCHVKNQDLFEETKMFNSFRTLGLHDCAGCHSAHDIQSLDNSIIALTEGSLCGRCHVAGDPGALVTLKIRSVIDKLRLNLDSAEVAIATAENKGMEVDELLFELLSGRTALIQSRTYVHTFDTAQVEEAALPGFSAAATIITEVDKITADFRMRRIGLGIATIIISFLAIVLYLYIKSIEGIKPE